LCIRSYLTSQITCVVCFPLTFKTAPQKPSASPAKSSGQAKSSDRPDQAVEKVISTILKQTGKKVDPGFLGGFKSGFQTVFSTIASALPVLLPLLALDQGSKKKRIDHENYRSGPQDIAKQQFDHWWANTDLKYGNAPLLPFTKGSLQMSRRMPGDGGPRRQRPHGSGPLRPNGRPFVKGGGGVSYASDQRGNNRAQDTTSSGPVHQQKRPSAHGIRVFAPSSVANVTQSGKPAYRTGRDSIVVTHREYIEDLTSPANTYWTAVITPVNPGLASTFPWLAGVANNYEEYRFRRLRVHYVPACSTALPGETAWSFDYDAADSAPASKQEQLSFEGAMVNPPWSGVTMDLRAPGQAIWRFVRNGNLASNLDIKTYDVANLCLAYNGITASTLVGALWLEYEVELRKVHFNTAATLGSANATFSTTGTSDTSWAGTVTQLHGGQSQISLATDVITFGASIVPGKYVVEFQITGTSMPNNTIPTMTPGALNGSQPPVVTLLSTTDWMTNGAGTIGFCAYQITVFSGGGTVTANLNTSTTLSAGVIRFYPAATP